MHIDLKKHILSKNKLEKKINNWSLFLSDDF